MTISRSAAMLAVALLLTTAAISLAVGWRDARAGFTGTAYVPPEPATDFRLVDHRGDTVTMDDYRGRAVLMFFGYTHCPDVCPTTLQRLRRVLDGMAGVDTTDLRVLLVTVDPDRDTPEALAEYVQRFGAFPVGLTGEPAELRALRDAYGIYSEPMSGGHAGAHATPEIGHTPQVLGFDRSGDLRVLLPMHEPDEVIAEDIELLLRS